MRERVENMNLDLEFDLLRNEWGSEEAVYSFLKSEFGRINVTAFEGRLSLPRFQIKPMWLSKGLMGERNSGADYEPSETARPAEIGVFTECLHDKDKTVCILAHEMVHHWEHTVADKDESTEYPPSLDREISEGLEGSFRERGWRRGHSRRFICKAYRVAEVLNLPPRTLLFGS
jgi:hypothetical protein